MLSVTSRQVCRALLGLTTRVALAWYVGLLRSAKAAVEPIPAATAMRIIHQ
jgi:hypothetical protein